MPNYFKNRKPELIDQQLKSLKLLMDFFKEKCGVYAYLSCGTLLGAVRNNDVIPHDKDYDIGYFSKATTHAEVEEELKQICTILIQYGILGKLFKKGENPKPPKIKDLFNFAGQMHVRTPDNKVAIDVFTSWAVSDKFYGTYVFQGQLSKNDIVPFSSINMRGIDFIIPKNSQLFLKTLYGDDWEIEKSEFNPTLNRKTIWKYNDK